eukprot:2539363-Amphidinium_carterae.1
MSFSATSLTRLHIPALPAIPKEFFSCSMSPLPTWRIVLIHTAVTITMIIVDAESCWGTPCVAKYVSRRSWSRERNELVKDHGGMWAGQNEVA